MVQARAHSEFLLASGTANPTSTSALCSCLCSSWPKQTCPSQSVSLQPVSAHEPPKLVYQHAEDGLNLLAEQQQILPGDTAELPEQLQLGDGGGLCFTSQSHHTTLGPS